jgi:hypothetical protein
MQKYFPVWENMIVIVVTGAKTASYYFWLKLQYETKYDFASWPLWTT